ncbi:methyltransferase domain-containing protein [Candidatus Nomurabacteria bacterium]|nr:methyltransferase domain-containing protein [Candidatus Nomurabacteria bacterium]
MFSDPEHNIEQFAVDPGSKVVDLGSGAGFYSLALSKVVGSSGKVYAVDVQQELLTKLKNESIRQGVSNIEIIWGDIEHRNGTMLADNSIDRVIIANTLFQITHKEEVLAEARRILKPKGTVLCIDWTDSFGGLGPPNHYVFKEDQAEILFRKAGFEFVRKIEAGDHHYGMIYRKS